LNKTEVSVGFDLTEQGDICDGRLSFDGETVAADIGGERVFAHGISDAAELKQFADVGCGRLELSLKDSNGKPKNNSENLFICRFSMSAMNEVAEFCKLVNHCIESGELGEISEKERRRCEKCGRPLPDGMDVCVFCVEKSYLLARVIKMMRPYWGKLIAAALLLITADALMVLLPKLNSIMIDTYLRPTGERVPMFAPETGILVLSALMIVCFFVKNLIYIASKRKTVRISSEFSHMLRRETYDKVQKLSLASMSKKTSGDLMKRITQDTEKVRNFIVNQGVSAIEQSIVCVLIMIMLVRISPLLTFLVFVPVPLVFFLVNRFWVGMRVRYDKQWRKDSRANSILHDIIKGIRVVKSFGNEEREIDKFRGACRELAQVSMKNEQLWALIFPALGFLIGAGEFLVLLVGGRMVVEGAMTLGELLMFILYLANIYQPLRWMSSLPRWLAEAQTSLIKLFEVIDERSSVEDPKEPIVPEVKGAIEFRGVKFGYKSYEPVLKDIELTIKPGEMIGLVGHSGAGKSTLINLIMRMYDPDSGAVKIDGVDLRDMEQHTLRSNIGVVFQETYLFSGTVYDNIAYADPNATFEEVLSAAKAANAHEFIIKLADGYNTVIGENGHTLSGGERQRIAIARAVLKNPKILILDEATSSLDPETEIKIQEALARLTKNRTTVSIAHRLSTLRGADRLVVLDHGRIAEVGTHRQLLEKKDGIYYKLVMAQRQTSRLKKEVEGAMKSAEQSVTVTA